MKFPTVHLNGTSAKDLYADNENAYNAVREAVEALTKAAPNGRDYYVQEAGAFYVAQDEHFDRMKRLQSVQAELEAILESVGRKL